MNIRRQKTAKQSSEVIDLDVRLERENDTSTDLELFSHKLKQDKDRVKYVEDLIRENEYLRQKIVFYKESRSVMLIFHEQILKFYNFLNLALKKFSKKMSLFEIDIMKY